MHLFNKENIWSNPQQFPAYSNDPVIQTRTIILWTELFPKKRREKISKERFFNLSSSTVVFPQIIQELQDIFEYSVFYSVSTRNPAGFQSSHAILHTELILPQEILQLQGSSRADQYKTSSSNCSPCLQAFYTAEPSSKHPRIGRVEEEF